MAESGERLARPFALNVITSSSEGGLTFSGEATSSDDASLQGSLVALVTGDFATGAIDFVAVEVVEGESGAEPFSLGPAPFGLYTIGAVRLSFEDPGSLAYGFYDPNGDGTPDILISQSGNDMVLAPPDPITAGEPVAEAQATAEAEAPGARLTGIAPGFVDEGGRSPSWRFRFESETDIVEVVSIGLFSLPIPSADDQRGFAEIPVPFLDSDRALEVAEVRGGAAFRAQEEGMGRTVRVAMGVNPTPPEMDLEWDVTYLSYDDPARPAVNSAQVRVPLTPSTTGESTPETGMALRVLTNPTRGSLRLGVSLGAPEAATITLVDPRGRTVAMLHRGVTMAGETVLDLALPDLPAGVYFVRVEVSGAARTVPVTVLR